MVFYTTFNNISVISLRSVLLVEETESGLPGENHWPVASHWQTLSHNNVSGQDQYVTKDRGRWWQIVDDLCPIGMKRISK
jgi:hypothetical protein